MKECPNCGQQNPDTTRYCLNCSEELYEIYETNPSQQTDKQPVMETNHVQQADEQPVSEAKPAQPINNFPVQKTNLAKTLSALFGIISGGIAEIFGILMLNMKSHTSIVSHIYGGDFYTGTSKQLESLGEYLENIFEILSLGLGFILIILGLFMIWHFLCKLADK